MLHYFNTSQHKSLLSCGNNVGYQRAVLANSIALSNNTLVAANEDLAIVGILCAASLNPNSVITLDFVRTRTRKKCCNFFVPRNSQQGYLLPASWMERGCMLLTPICCIVISVLLSDPNEEMLADCAIILNVLWRSCTNHMQQAYKRQARSPPGVIFLHCKYVAQASSRRLKLASQAERGV